MGGDQGRVFGLIVRSGGHAKLLEVGWGLPLPLPHGHDGVSARFRAAVPRRVVKSGDLD